MEKPLSRGVNATFGLGLFGVISLAWGVCYALEPLEKLPAPLRTNGKQTLSSVAELDQRLAAITVEILDAEERVALGTIVREDGLVVTKASELGWKTVVRLPDSREVLPVSVAVDENNDVAALRLDVSLTHVAPLHEVVRVSRGKILVSPSGPKRSAKIGIVSANSRSIKREGGALGILMGRQGLALGGVQVGQVLEETAAARAGIQQGDIISSVNGEVVLLVEQLQAAIAAHHPGENVELMLHRGEETLNLNVTLGFRSTYFGHFDRNQLLSGETSTRLSGFEQVMQHDIPVHVRSMGGAVMDLSGRVIGINIARVDRVTTFALPTTLLRRVLAKLGDEFKLRDAE